MKNVVFWDVVLCGYCKKLCFGGMYRFHHLGTKMRELGTKLAVTSSTISWQRASVASYS
jgi:hypothetical protein